MTLVPGTRVAAIFQTVTGRFPPLFYDAGDDGAVMASMNAGNAPQLYLGGGGLNAGFATALSRQNIAAYQNLHVALADNVPRGQVRYQGFANTNPVASMTICNKRVVGARDYTGVAFLDAFSPRFCPGGNPANRAMAYVAPPDGRDYTDRGAFLSDVAAVSEHAVEAVAGHNAAMAQSGGEPIRALRLCLYSSSIYRMSGVTADEVALAIFDGLQKALTVGDTGLTEVQMPVSRAGGEAYFDAVQMKLASG